MRNIFLSYSRESETKTLASDLEALGHSAWFDHELSGGQDWWDQILLRIRESDLFMFVLDNHSLESTACKREYRYAAELDKPILPVLVANDVSTNLLPVELSKVQFVEFRNRDADAAIRLSRAITAVPPCTPLPDPLPSPPEIPVSYLGGIAEQIEVDTTLTPQEQKALLFELRQCLKDPQIKSDTLVLVDRFRRRPDLLATIADELDVLSGGILLAKSTEPSDTTSAQPTSVKDRGQKETSHSPSKKNRGNNTVPPNRSRSANTTLKRKLLTFLVATAWCLASMFLSFIVFEENNIRVAGLSDDETGLFFGGFLSLVGVVFLLKWYLKGAKGK